jgi:parafibromin
MAPQTNGRQAANSQQTRNNRQAAGYSRYDQEVFHSEPDADFQIETNLSFHGTSFNAIRGGNLNSTNNTLNDTVGSQNDNRRRSNQQVSTRDNRPGFGPSSAVHPNGKPPKKESRTPIIIIPASGTALITMFNAVDLLQVCLYSFVEM